MTQDQHVTVVSMPNSVLDEPSTADMKNVEQRDEAESKVTEQSGAEGDRRVQRPMAMSSRIALATGFCVARHPCKALAACWLGIFSLTAIGILSGELSFSDGGSKDWSIMDDTLTEQRDAMTLARQQVDCIRNADGKCPEVPVRSGTSGQLSLSLIYEASGDTMFSSERLQRACKVEQLVVQNKYFPKFCQLRAGALEEVKEQKRDYNASDCEPTSSSVVELFYGSSGKDKCELLSDAYVKQVSDMLLASLKDPVQKISTGFFIGAGTADEPPRRSRSLFFLGYPLEDQTDVGEGSNVELRSATAPFWDSLEDDFMKFFGKSHTFIRTAYWEPWMTGDVEVMMYAAPLVSKESSRVVNSDTSFVLLAIIFVIVWLCFHTGSVFIGIVSLGQILFSIPVAFFFYRFIGQVTFFQQLHAILIFIMLGIGADSVFVFSDAWYQSVQLLEDGNTDVHVEGSDPVSILAARIAVAHQRTLVSVFNTSFTTGVAFLATAISPIMPIKTMGIFACLLVLMNYIFCITVTPSVFAVWYTYNVRCPCRCRFPRQDAAQDAGAPSNDNGQPESVPADGSKPDEAVAVIGPKQGLLQSYYVPMFGKPIVSAIIVLVLLAWGLTNLYFASRLEAPPEMFQYFSDAHMHTRAADLSREGFVSGSSGDYLTLSLTFGVQGVDRSPKGGKTMDPWAPDLYYGEPVWDNSFDLSQAATQDYMRGFCKRMRIKACGVEACKDDRLFQQADEHIGCFIEEFDRWQGGVRTEGKAFLEKLVEFRETQRPMNSVTGSSWKNAIGYVNGELRFVKLDGKMSVRRWLPGKLKEDVIAVIDEWLEEEKGLAPSSAGTVMQTAGFDWSFLALEKELVNGLFTGFAICFPVSFIVLLFATGNIIVAFLAIVTIVLIVMNVLGWCWVVEGWYLGVSESIAGVIVIGLAVDYVIHLGHMYLEVGHLGCVTRGERWAAALNSMGTTVLAGSATTFMAGMSMRVCQMTFFTQMSTLISVTIFYSIIYALFFFMGILRVVGPEGDFGDVKALALKVRSKLSGSAA